MLRRTIMKTLNLKEQFAPYYKLRRGALAIVDVPAANFLMIDGTGNPNTSPAFKEAVEALYALSYTLKFMLKMEKKTYDYPVMPLEGLWWSKDMAAFALDNRRDWIWRLMIMQPDIITPEIYREGAAALRKKKEVAALGRERLETFEEGLSAQILHIGPYAEEGPTIRRLHEYIGEKGFALAGKHHEIYFGDPRRANPANLKTILRQPVKKGS
jgi:hypothetical protein